MSETFKAGALAATGSLESAAGDILDRPDLQMDGAAKQMKGRAQRTFAKVQDKAEALVDQASAKAAVVAGRAKEFYVGASGRADKVAAQVDPFVREQPYAALGIAAAVGFLAGMIFAGRGSKIVYLKAPSP